MIWVKCLNCGYIHKHKILSLPAGDLKFYHCKLCNAYGGVIVEKEINL